MSEKIYRRVLTIAGSDSGGGAGIQADLKTFAANGCYGMSVITALTAQNTLGVSGIHPVPVAFVEQQLDAVLGDIGADAVKIGMLFSVELIAAVARKLRDYDAQRIVLDPVMVAKGGDRLLQEDAIAALKEHLFPLAEVITPNLPEAEDLLGRTISGRAEMLAAGRDLVQWGPRYVLVKGGHADGHNSEDVLVASAGGEGTWFGAARVATQNTHGTGCTLSSAIAAQLAQGLSVPDAVDKARDYIQQAIRAGAAYRLGQGHGPVHHFWPFWG
ncbi:MAG: bifunctional hydroxymethylpyrimidine kinase/phosphomethylpyrimidine kinase [Kiritimatiellia bacterium]|jgi:hydroxymethylpyrimidine/phosphomethylpyrimidine kinase|nr:bifunctional hydroxymethylpyrimidine kinase/phosphomethylpyrimidine kinase [Kiritimatiellia bacterium]